MEYNFFSKYHNLNALLVIEFLQKSDLDFTKLFLNLTYFTGPLKEIV